MTINDVSSAPNPVAVNSPLVIQFRLLGGVSPYFIFPFSNESLVEKKIQFVEKEENQNA